MEIGQPARRSGFGASVIAVTTVLFGVTPQTEAQARGLNGTAGPYQLEVLVGGNAAPTFSHGGDTYVLGQPGERYTLRVWNRTPARIEAVVTVDGRDVVDGKPGDFHRKRGYMVNAGGFVDIDGWRLSQHQAAAFRFTSVANSYAARTGDARNVGVIGVAVFPERIRARPPLQLIAPDRDRLADRGRSERQRAGPSTVGRPRPAPGPGDRIRRIGEFADPRGAIHPGQPDGARRRSRRSLQRPPGAAGGRDRRRWPL